jgi:uncharacterized protein
LWAFPLGEQTGSYPQVGTLTEERGRVSLPLMKPLVLFMVALATACSDGSGGNQSRQNHPSKQHHMASQPALVLRGRITDGAGILDAARTADLTKRLDQLEQATGHQMVIVTVTTLNGRDVAAFTKDLSNAWGIGRAEHDDGVILLVAPNERKVRIAVGYGLEETLPNGLCRQIIEERILPPFREGDLPRGIEAGATALISQLL